MKVTEIKYQRYTVEEARAAFGQFENAIKAAKCAEDVLKARDIFQEAIIECSTSGSLAYMRFTLDTRDEFYKGEMDYYDEVNPLIGELQVKYCDYMLSSPYRAELEKVLNPILFKSYEMAKLAHDPRNIEDEQLENSIVTEYSSLMSQMMFDYKGEKVPMTLVRGDLSASDRAVRKAAMEAIGKGLEANSEKLDDIFDRLVKVRDRQAKRLGFENYITLGYYQMNRFDYDRKMVEDFRQNVKTDLVPVISKMKNDVAKKLGIDQIMLYDNDVYSAEGNVRPMLDKDGIFEAAIKMYDAMNPEIGAFMHSMIEADAFDVESREGKWGGGYCTEFPKYKQTFILANFNGSSDDIDVVTHEFGHAFAMDQSFKDGDFELGIGGMETAECHSMSMEFLSWKYMDKFFEEPDKYKLKHVCDSLSFIPYGVIVDEFQHVVYENPELTPAQRNEEWNKLEKKYRPYLSTEGIPYIENGTRWQYQMHIYERPFYYIDYCLAQTVALGFLVESRKDYADALSRYVTFAKAGGTKLFSALVKDANIANPFGKGTLCGVASEITKVLEELGG
ncbi:MAG: M3 family oligoendopeptidase [Clostridia bacterium]|nr:M3 family oligoendopeptidase [Clostridia bacterium]